MIKHVAALAFFLGATGALACPDPSAWGEAYDVTAKKLYEAHGLEVVAGGEAELSRCGVLASNHRGTPVGWVAGRPDFSITVRELTGYAIEFRVESECDSVLLINTASGNWYYDDDDNGAGDPKIRLNRPSGDGIYDIWVGTYMPGNCQAQVILEMF